MKTLMQTFAVVAYFWFSEHFAYAQESQPSATEKLGECVAFFTQGGPLEWILGGVFLLATVLGLFFKQSVIGLLKDMAGKLLDGKKK